jgi:hypothetical protein
MLAKAPDHEVTSEARLHIRTEGYDYLWAWEGHEQQLRGNKGRFPYQIFKRLLCRTVVAVQADELVELSFLSMLKSFDILVGGQAFNSQEQAYL